MRAIAVKNAASSCYFCELLCHLIGFMINTLPVGTCLYATLAHGCVHAARTPLYL